MAKAKKRKSSAPVRLRLKMPGWGTGEFIRRVDPATPVRTYDEWRDLLLAAYRDSFFDVLDALASKRVSLAKAVELKRSGSLLTVRRYLEELAAKEAAQAAGGDFEAWMAEFLELQPRMKAGRPVSEKQHVAIIRGAGAFLDFLADRHGLAGRAAVPAALWTRDNLRLFVQHYIAKQCAASKKRLDKQWAAMASPPTSVDQAETLRKDRGRKQNSANRIVNGVGAFSQWLLECTPPRVAVDPAVGVRISVRAESMHRDDDHRSLTPAQLKEFRGHAAAFDAGGRGGKRQRAGIVRPDPLWYDWLVASGATTYTEGARLSRADIREGSERAGMVPVKVQGSKAAERKRTVWISRALADKLLARAAERGIPRRAAIFPITAETGSAEWRKLLKFIAGRDPDLHAEIEDLTPYAFRHTFAVNAIRAGVDIYTLKKLMGHASITTTEIYLKHAAPPRRALARMTKRLGLDD